MLERVVRILDRDTVFAIISAAIYLYFFSGALFSGPIYKNDISGFIVSLDLLNDRFRNAYLYGSGAFNYTIPYFYAQSALNVLLPQQVLGEKVFLVLPLPLAVLSSLRLLTRIGVPRHSKWALASLYSLSPLMVFHALYVAVPFAWLYALFPTIISGLHDFSSKSVTHTKILREALIVAFVSSLSLENATVLLPFGLVFLAVAFRNSFGVGLRVLKALILLSLIALIPLLSYLLVFVALPYTGYRTFGSLPSLTDFNSSTFVTYGYGPFGDYWKWLVLILALLQLGFVIFSQRAKGQFLGYMAGYCAISFSMVALLWLPTSVQIKLLSLPPLQSYYKWQLPVLISNLSFLLSTFHFFENFRFQISSVSPAHEPMFNSIAAGERRTRAKWVALAPQRRIAAATVLLVILPLLLFDMFVVTDPFYNRNTSLLGLRDGFAVSRNEIPNSFKLISDWLVVHRALDHEYRVLLFPMPPNYGYFINHYVAPNYIPNLVLFPGDGMLPILGPIADNATRAFGSKVTRYGVKYVIINLQVLPEGHGANDPDCKCSYWPNRNYNTGPPAMIRAGPFLLPVGSPQSYILFFSRQLDLQLVHQDQSFWVFENLAFRPALAFQNLLLVPPGGSLAVDHSVFYQSENLIKDPDFLNLSSWHFVGSGHYSSVNAQAGGKVLSLSVPANETPGVHWLSAEQIIPLQAMRSYTFTIDVGFHNVNQTAIWIAFFDSKWSLMNFVYPLTGSIGSSPITSHFFNFTVPAGVAFGDLWLSGGWGLSQESDPQSGISVFYKPQLRLSFYHPPPSVLVDTSDSALFLDLTGVPEAKFEAYTRIASGVASPLPFDPASWPRTLEGDGFSYVSFVSPPSVLNPRFGNWSVLAGRADNLYYANAIGSSIANASLWFPRGGQLNLQLRGMLNGTAKFSFDDFEDLLSLNLTSPSSTLLNLNLSIARGWHELMVDLTEGSLTLTQVVLELRTGDNRILSADGKFERLGSIPGLVQQGPSLFAVFNLPANKSVFIYFPERLETGWVLRYMGTIASAIADPLTGYAIFRVNIGSEREASIEFPPQPLFAAFQVGGSITSLALTTLGLASFPIDRIRKRRKTVALG